MQFRIIVAFRYAKEYPHFETANDTVSSPPPDHPVTPKKILSKG